MPYNSYVQQNPNPNSFNNSNMMFESSQNTQEYPRFNSIQFNESNQYNHNNQNGQINIGNNKTMTKDPLADLFG